MTTTDQSSLANQTVKQPRTHEVGKIIDLKSLALEDKFNNSSVCKHWYRQWNNSTSAELIKVKEIVRRKTQNTTLAFRD